MSTENNEQAAHEDNVVIVGTKTEMDEGVPAPDGSCPWCWRDGDDVQLEYNEEWETDECPQCEYYE